MKSTVFVAGLLLMTVSVLAGGQAGIASGEIAGVVTDPSGGVVPDVQITVTNATNGIERNLKTDSLGNYRVLLLPPGQYDVTAQIEKFNAQVKKSIRVGVGETTVVNFQLVIGQTVQIDVTDFLPVVETQRSHQANIIGEEYIRALPIDRRDYLTYTLLAPGV